MTFRRSDRVAGIELSEIVQITERAAALKAMGRDVVALSTGEPDFPTPPHVIEAAHQAALAGKTRYTATAGTADLRAAIAADAGWGSVIVSTGAKQVIANSMLATLNPGDQVVIPAPYWTSYSDIVSLAGGVPVVVACGADQGFKLSAQALEAALTPQTRWLMLNAPSNPTGAIYTVAEMRALAEVLSRHPEVWVLSDEIYEHLNFIPFTRFADAVPGLRERLLTVNGVAKAWSMTGWRIGWGIGPAPLIAAMGAVQGQLTSGANSLAQAAALAALTGPADLLETRRQVLRARRDRVVAALNAMPGVDCPMPDGAFYVFPRLTVPGRPDDAALCHWLLETHGLAIVPGRAFDLAGHARISFAYGQADLDRGLTRLAAALEGR